MEYSGHGVRFELSLERIPQHGWHTPPGPSIQMWSTHWAVAVPPAITSALEDSSRPGWDQRRLIVPMTRLIEGPFQNWTRSSADLVQREYPDGLPRIRASFAADPKERSPAYSAAERTA